MSEREAARIVPVAPALNTWPALQTYHYDGSVVRFANGMGRRGDRANVIRPLRRRVTYSAK